MKTKTRFHKLTAWFLTLAMLMTFIPSFTLGVSAETITGTAGTVHYTIDEYGVMTISGSGTIPQGFDSSSYINSNDKQLVKRIVIEDGITGIGQQSLDTFYNLTSVSIAKTVTSIGQYAFVNCSKIKTITYWGTSRFTTTNILSSSVTPTIYVNTNYSNATMFGKTVTKILTDTSKECTVKFDMNGYGTQVDSQYVFNIDGYNKVTKPTDPSAPEVKFEGWYKDSEFNTAWNFDTDTVSDNTTIYAKWNTTPDHTVSFNMGSYGTAISDRGVVSGSLIAEPETPTDDDALFLGWYKDSNFETPWDFASDTVTSDTTLYAEWRLWYGTAPSTGDGSESSPFEIGTADELYWFADYYNNSGKLSSAYVILVDDITVNQNVLNADGTLNGDGSSFRVWQPIGNSSIRYVGTFDGQGHTISGLYFNNTDSTEGTYVGFIGRLGAGTVKNLEVADSYFKGYQNVGGIVGSGQSSTASYIENCKSSSTVYASSQYAGGISGNYSTVKNSLFVGKVGGVKSVGAIYGSYQYAHISNCYYLTNCAQYDNGKVQYGIGTSQTNSNSTDGNNVNYFAVNTTQLASGEIAYKLQGAQEDDSVVVWGQQLTGENSDAYPALGGPRVVLDTATGTYINSEEGSSHTRVRGYCCDEDYDEPVFVDESNCASLGLTSDYIGYYAISNYGQLYGFAKIVNGGDYDANAVLTDNIVANKNVLKADGTLNGDEQSLWQWNPILTDGDVEAPEYADKYEGTFDGNNKYISGLYYNNSVGTVRGLFGYVGENGVVKNLGIVDSCFYGQRAVGAIAGYNFGNIENCYNEGTIKAYPKKSTGMMNESGYFGGIVGCNEGSIENCHNEGYVSGATAARWIGGICGTIEGGNLDKCYNTGTVDGTTRVGGIVGEIYSSSVSNTYNIGDISSTSTSTSTTASVGGIAGVSNGNGVVVPEIKTSYNFGKVSAPAYVGGILGHTLKNPVVTNCYYLKDSAVDSNGSVDNGYGNALTLEQMTDDENWKTNFAGFDTTNVWSKDENTASAWYLPTLDSNSPSVVPPHIHEWTYIANGDTITATCEADGCPETDAKTIVISASDKEYDGTAATATVTNNVDSTDYSASIVYEAKTGSLTEGKAVNVGTYTAKITVGDVTASVDFEITAKSLSGAVVTVDSNANLGYTGNAITPDVSVTLDGKTLTTNDYTVSYSDNTNVGQAIVTVTGKGNYKDTASTNFIITKATPVVTAPGVITGLSYTGQAQTLINEGSTTGGTIQYSLDDVTYSTNIPTGSNAGTYTVYYKVIGNDNYNDVAASSASVTISPKTVTNPTFDGLVTTQLHTGSAIEPTFTLKDGDTEIPESEYDVAYSNNINVGEATITITDRENGNYNVSGTAKFTIAKHTHDWNISSNGNVITATCQSTFGTCPNPTSMVTLVAPENLVYDGNDKVVTTNGTIEGVTIPDVQYTGDRKNVGTFTASLTVDNVMATLSVTIEKAEVNNVSFDVTAPEALNEKQTTVANGTGYTAAISWNTEAEKFGFNAAYTATVTLTTDGNHKFADNLSKDDWTVELNADKTVATFTKTFEKTRMQKIESVTAPSNVNLDSHKSDAAAVIATLPTTVSVALEENGTDELSIVWSCADFNTAPLSENTFTWNATNNKYDSNNVTLTGTIKVTNPAANAVTITVKTENTTVVYNATDVELTSLFDIDTNAGSATYTVTNGTGAGTQSGTTLIVTKAGTFTVKVDTTANGIYAAGTQTATLTVNKANGTGTVSMEGWTYGETEKAPAISGNKGEATYQYKARGADDSTYSSDKPSNAGEYTVKATFAETDLYNEAFATADFAIAKKDIAGATVGAFEQLTYTGEAQTPSATVTIGNLTVTGNWSNVTNVADTTTFTANGNFTGTIENQTTGMLKAVSSVTTTPNANTLTYNEAAQELITEGEANGGTIKYSLDNTTWAEAIPTGTDAGNYEVWYKVFGDANHNDTEAVKVDTSIAKKSIDSAIVLTAPVKNTVPQTEITGDGYTATVTWSPEVTDRFGYNTEYTAIITISVDENHTVTGIAENGYTVEGAKSVVNAAGSNEITVAYEKTGSRPSSGGGGGSNTTTTTTKNEDGSTTKTTTNKSTGTVTEVTTWPDGSSKTVETKKDGTVTTTEKDKDGNTTTTVEKPDGTSTTTEKNKDGSEKVTEEKADGTTVTTEKDTDGTKTVTTENADGSKTTEETKKDGTKVTTETNADGETKTEIDLPKDKETEVTIPAPNAEDVTSITVTDKDGKETEITDFEITEDGVKVTVSGDCTAVINKAAKKEFADVHPVNHWATADIDYAYINGLMMGTSETHFSPDVPLTRAMLVTVLYRLEGEPRVSGITSFADLEKGQYYLDAVCWAQVNGIVNGTTDTTFAPDDNITREQIAAIMHRYAQYKGYDVSVGENTNILSYDDFDSISEYAIASMQYAAGSGLMKGKTTSTLNPLDNATRAEIAAILHRFIEANK